MGNIYERVVCSVASLQASKNESNPPCEWSSRRQERHSFIAELKVFCDIVALPLGPHFKKELLVYSRT